MITTIWNFIDRIQVGKLFIVIGWTILMILVGMFLHKQEIDINISECERIHNVYKCKLVAIPVPHTLP